MFLKETGSLVSFISRAPAYACAISVGYFSDCDTPQQAIYDLIRCLNDTEFLGSVHLISTRIQ